MGAFYAGTLVALPAFSAMVRRSGVRFALRVGLALIALSALAMGVMGDIWVLIILRAFQGAGWAGVLITTALLATALSPAERLAQGIGIYGACFLIGQAIGPAIGELTLGETKAFTVFFITAACLSILPFVLLPLLPAQVKLNTPSRQGPPAGILLRILPVMEGFCLITGWGAALQLISDYASQLSFMSIWTFFMGHMIGGLAMRFGCGQFLDRFQRGHVTALGAFVNAAGLFLLAYLSHEWVLWPAGILLGASSGVYSSALQAAMIERFGDRVRAVTVFRATTMVGVSIAALGGGWLASASSYPEMYAIFAMLSLAAGFLAFAETIFPARPVYVA
jgi:MFS family permease